jgi:transcriptional regulator with GAF, ATPase, and Fis domain
MSELRTQRMERSAAVGLSTVVALQRVRLHVIEGPDAGRGVESDDDMLLRLGTRENNHLVLSDKSVSGYHLEISRRVGGDIEPATASSDEGDRSGWRLRDVGSTNGTYVGSLRVFDVQLRPGTIISVGRSRLRFDAIDDRPLRATLYPRERFFDMVGASVAMRRMFARIEQVAATPATVLITGETGTGKEAVAEALVQASPRASAPFVVIDCSALPANLIESELFGHVKGAFTGAHGDYRGAFERAAGGTVFLDEIGELPLDLQPKLLRVLERREVRRIGSESVRAVDVRVIAATNRDLGAEVNERRFRQDLYFRLSVVNIHIPPLRDRRDDLPLLIQHFASHHLRGAQGAGRSSSTAVALAEEICSRVLESNADYHWPGNVRELRNVVERAVAIPDEDPLAASAPRQPQAGLEATDPPSPPEGRAASEGPAGGSGPAAVDINIPFKSAKQALIDDFERRYISALLKAARNNVSEAARRAQIDRMYLHKLITQHRLNES